MRLSERLEQQAPLVRIDGAVQAVVDDMSATRASLLAARERPGRPPRPEDSRRVLPCVPRRLSSAA